MLFGKARENRSMNETGCGLGLTICEKIIKKLGGNIHLESEKDKGTTVYFTVEFEQDEDVLYIPNEDHNNFIPKGTKGSFLKKAQNALPLIKTKGMCSIRSQSFRLEKDHPPCHPFLERLDQLFPFIYLLLKSKIPI